MTMDNDSPNPFESPAEAPPVRRPPSKPSRKGPQEREFSNLSLQLKAIGGLITLIGLLATIANWYWTPMLVIGVAICVFGWGLGVYKPWAWFGAVLLLLPLSLLILVLTGFLFLNQGAIGIPLLTAPIYLWYVLWVLLSKRGRDRYREMGEARLRARDNPDSIAGRLYRKR